VEYDPDGRVVGPVPGALALIAVVPVTAGGRAVGAVLAADVLNHESRLLDRYRTITANRSALSLGGVRVASDIPQERGRQAGTRLPAYVLGPVLAGQQYLLRDDGPDGLTRAWNYAPLRTAAGEVVGAAESETSFTSLAAALSEMEKARQEFSSVGTRSLLIRLVVVAVIVLFLSALAANGIASPLRALRREVQRIARGEFEGAGKIEILTGDEIQQLAEDFTAMAGQLREAREQERMALVGQMASSVFHDLRNPLTSIQGFAPLLADPKTTPEEKQEFLQAIDEESQRITSMISDLLEFSRGRDVPQKTPELLDEFVEHTAELLAMDLRNSAIKLEVLLGSRARVLLDPNRMTRVLANLATNAREAMPQGGRLTIETRREGQLALIVVTDTGPGVPAEAREQLFEPFYTYGKVHGTGLGLAICKQIVTAHGGAIALEQKEGQGARFVISLPAVQEGGHWARPEA
jgi:signal transduction histidine kinase